MNKKGFLATFVVSLSLLSATCVRAESKVRLVEEYSSNPDYLACKAAGGAPGVLIECDGSQSLWCKVSDREQCYADQLKDGRCSVGHYSEEMGGMVGISPRVLCDGADTQ